MCEFDKLDKTFASDLYLIYKRSPSARVCISDTNRNIKSWCSGTADIQCESLTFRAYRRYCINATCRDNYLAVNFFSSREVNDWAWKTFNVSSEFGKTIFFIHFTFLTDAFARNVKPRIRIPAVHLQSFHILIYISTLPKQHNETFIVNYLVWKLLRNIVEILPRCMHSSLFVVSWISKWHCRKNFLSGLSLHAACLLRN